MTSFVPTSLKRWFSGAPEGAGNQPCLSHLPKGVPDSVHEAYQQACFLLAHSPRASGALSRYALQKIVRDFWRLSAEQQGTIAYELDLVADRMQPETQQSIACVRGFGTIEFQLAGDRDLLVEATAGEAKLLIALVQLLSRQWYEERRRRQAHLDAIRAMAAETAQPLMRAGPPERTHEAAAGAASAPPPPEGGESAWRVESGWR